MAQGMGTPANQPHAHLHGLGSNASASAPAWGEAAATAHPSGPRRRLLNAGCIDDAPQRVLVYTSQKTGGSLMVDALGQFPRTVTLDLYPGKEGPEPGLLPRPMSAFQIYAREVMDEYVKNSPTAKKEDLFKAIGDKFFSMPASQSAPYKLKEEESKQPENRIMVVMKAVTNPWTLGWQYVANFKPDARILFVRHPAHVVKALKITPDNEKSAAKKLKQLDHGKLMHLMMGVAVNEHHVATARQVR